ncbi:Nup93/Nic96-domain-containing protein [Pelagophyceae sp. CCMP2097]|nr:Nup93/Nic96-domain-containing protein [Pelagophyceae sp. CCMP2097]
MMFSSNLSALAVSAESLVARHVGSSSVPALQKGLAELEAESLAFANVGGAAEPRGAPTDYAGAALLAGGKFDAAALHRQILELEMRAEYAGDAELDDVDSALAEHTDGVVVSAIEAAVRDALADSESAALTHALESWERDKARILEQMGLRAFDWRAGARAAKGDARAQAWLARGGRRFLEDQHRDFVEAKLRDARASLRAHVMGLEAYDAADDAARYVALLRARGELPRESARAQSRTRAAAPQSFEMAGPAAGGRGEAVWPQLYVALRSGGAAGAVAVARRHAGELGAVAVDAVEAHAAYDAEVEVEFWLVDARSRAPERDEAARRLAEAAHAAAALYARLGSAHADAQRRADVDELVCPYCLAALNALCFGAADERERHVLQTVEDFMWQQLWFCTPAPVSAADGDGARSQRAGDGAPLAALQASLVRWGPRHFDPDGANPWQYANQVLLGGDFARVAQHLAEAGLAREALHFAVAMDAYGLVAVAAPSNKRPAGEALDGGAAATFELGRALRAYAKHVAATGGPALALEYVAWMRRRDAFDGGARQPSLDDVAKTLESFDEYGFVAEADAALRDGLAGGVVSLIVETRDFGAVCGTVIADGSRSAGLVDAHFDRGEADALIAVAARVAAARGRAADAVDLYVLSRRYVEAVGVYAEYLARVVVPPKAGAAHAAAARDRATWVAAARAFAEAHLQRGRTYVVDALTREGATDLGRAFEALLNLATLFDHVSARQFGEAIALLDGLRLVPAAEQDVAARLDDFHDLPAPVQKVFGAVAVAAVEALYALHDQARCSANDEARRRPGAASPRPRADASDAATSELRRRASVLVNFAGLLKLRLAADVHATLARYEAMMM